MCEVQLAAHPELWEATSTYLETRGPEKDRQMWQEAEHILDGLCRQHEHYGSNEAAHLALADAFSRCKEERRRAEESLKLHEVWDSRPIGGVGEPESAVRE